MRTLTKYSPVFGSRVLHRFVGCSFCEAKKPKTYVMPEARPAPRLHRPKEKLVFRNGRCLVFLNQQNLITPYLLDLHFILSVSYLAFLIKTNPFYLTFPAALPLMVIIEGILILKWVHRKAHFKRTVERVYLLDSGVQLEIVYSNKIRRIVKDNDMNEYFRIQQFVNRFKDEEMEGRIEPLRGCRFPTDPDINPEDIHRPLFNQYGWSVRDQDFQTYIFPSGYEYCNWDIMAKIFNGISINVEDASSEGEFNLYSTPTIEQEMKRLEEGKHLTTKTEEPQKQKTQTDKQ